MTHFHVGDKVKYIGCGSNLNLGDIYTVSRVSLQGYSIVVGKDEFWFDIRDFTKVVDDVPKTVLDSLKVGDQVYHVGTSLDFNSSTKYTVAVVSLTGDLYLENGNRWYKSSDFIKATAFAPAPETAPASTEKKIKTGDKVIYIGTSPSLVFNKMYTVDIVSAFGGLTTLTTAPGFYSVDDFVEMIAAEPAPETTPEPTASLTAPFWLVWRSGGDAPTKRHATLVNAENEARRLTEKHPGVRFFVLELVSGFECSVSPVTKVQIQPKAKPPTRKEKRAAYAESARADNPCREVPTMQEVAHGEYEPVFQINDM
jgi:hypothetical protein